MMIRFFICSLVLLQSHAFSQKVIIEAYGDSLTAGLLDYTNIALAPELPTVSKILADLTMFKLTNDRSYLNKHEKHELAWPQLLAKRLESSDVKYEVRNYGLSGARSDSLLNEVKFAQAVSPNDSVIAFFFIGHNDLCHVKGSVEGLSRIYSENFNQAIEEWDKTHRGAKAFFISVGEVQRIYPLLDEYVWFEKSRGKYRCNESWDKLFPYCPWFYRKYKEGSLDDYLIPRVERLNASLKQLSEQWRSKSLRNQYSYLEGMGNSKLTTDFFAVDCYHLSQAGQEFVSNKVFDSISWQ